MSKRNFIFQILLGLILVIGQPAVAVEQYGDLLECQEVINISDSKGETFLSFMQKTVKPAMDVKATTGYRVASGNKMVADLENVSDKVKMKAIRAAGSEDALRNLGRKLSGEMVTLYTLPGLIAKAGSEYSRGRFDLSTYIGLSSCGGAIVKFYDDNYAYNIHYGTGVVAKDNRTGRSFGASRVRNADDASDKAYLTDLEEFTHGDDQTTAEFYKTLILSLTNSDTAGYAKISDMGQNVLTDFLAVYIAEQARNLMDNKITLHWDAALLEVTLLSAFHAGQKDIQLLFYDPNQDKTVFTSVVYNQAPGGEARTKKRKASLIDYWQFSQSTDPEHKNRSGINLTKDQFRALGAAITAYEVKKNPTLVSNVRRHMAGVSESDNVFKDFSTFLINPKTPARLGKKGADLSIDFVKLLAQVKKDAEKISDQLRSEYGTL